MRSKLTLMASMLLLVATSGTAAATHDPINDPTHPPPIGIHCDDLGELCIDECPLICEGDCPVLRILAWIWDIDGFVMGCVGPLPWPLG